MYANDVIYLTEEGVRKLETELVHLSTVRSAEVAEKLSEITDDLEENPQYDTIRREQAHIHARIAELEDALRHAVVIANDGPADAVRVGSTVRISEEGWEDDIEEYRIVGVHEAAPTEGLISNKSPIGSALLGAKIGDIIAAETPGGETRFRVLAIV